MTLSDAASALLRSSHVAPPAAVPAVTSSNEEQSFPSPPSADSASEDPTPVTATSVFVTSETKMGFVETLMQTLDNEKEYSQIITWMPDGTAFTIVNHKRFTKEEMPKVFGIRNMSSFVRKLTRFGFTRRFDKETMNSDIFAHEDFVRGKPDRASARIKFAPLIKASATAAVARAQAAAASKASNAPVPSKATTTSPPPAVSRGKSPFTSFTKQTPLTVSPSQELARHVSVESNLSLSASIAVKKDDFQRTSIYKGLMLVPPSPSPAGPGGSLLTSDLAIGAAIESLLRERDALRQGADANALALIRLLEQQRAHQQHRRESLPTTESVQGPSLSTAQLVLLEHRASAVSGVYPSFLTSSQSSLSLPVQQARGFPYRPLY